MKPNHSLTSRVVLAASVGCVVLLSLACGGSGRAKSTATDPASTEPAPAPTNATTPKGTIVKTLPMDEMVGAVRVRLTADMYEYDDKRRPRIVVRLVNTDQTKRLTYRPWVQVAGTSLVDNFGNKLSAVMVDREVQRLKDTELFPDKVVSDVLIWDTPVPAATTLTIRLPARAVGGPNLETWEFHVDVASLVRTQGETLPD